MSQEPDPDRVELARFLSESGESPRQVGRLLGVSGTTIRRWLNPDEANRQRVQAREAKRRRTGICKTCGGITRYNGQKGKGVSDECADCAARRQHEARYWTRERIIEAIQTWATERGKPPSASDWLHAGPDKRWPNRGSVYNDDGKKGKYVPFRTWGDAIEAAGFPRPLPTYHGKAFEKVWTQEATIARLQSWAAEHGRTPTERDWTGRAEGRPTASWVAQSFGSWTKALKAAGLPLYRKEVRWTKDVIIAFLQEHATDGTAPSSSINRPMAGAAKREFGSWIQACAAAGLQPVGPGHHAVERAIVTRNATPKEATDEEHERETTPAATRRGLLARLARRRRT